MAKQRGAIPISDARLIGKRNRCPVVVIFALEERDNRFTVTTWGRNRNLCKLAAGFGEDIAQAIFDGRIEARPTPDGLPDEPKVMEGMRRSGING